MIEHGGDGTPRPAAIRDVPATRALALDWAALVRLTGVGALAVAWWTPSLVSGDVLPPTTALAALALVAWWVLLGVAASAVDSETGGIGLWAGTVAATLAGSAVVGVTGAAAPGWLDSAGHGLAIMGLAYLAAMPAARAVARVRSVHLRPARRRAAVPLLRRALTLLPGMACLVPPLLLTSPNDQVLGTIACAVIGAITGWLGLVGLPGLWTGAAALPLLSAASYAAGIGLPGPSGMPIEFALGLVGFVLLAATPGHLAAAAARSVRRGIGREPVQAQPPARPLPPAAGAASHPSPARPSATRGAPPTAKGASPEPGTSRGGTH